jgi:ParB/RepB/Spo0J family partition protein
MHSIDLRSVPISAVFESAFNTRTHFDADKMRDLEASIREVGVLTPLIVRPVGERYELAAGHRRLRAALAAGVETVPVSVRALTDLQLREVITIENLQREDIHPLDEAEGYRSILKASKAYTVAIVAAKVGKSESYVYRRLKLLELEPDLRAALSENRLSVAHAERLCRLPPDLRKEAADPNNGVVWRHSPLVSYGEDETPQREDLQPLHALDQFIRTRHHFDPAARDTRHFQEELAVQLDDVERAITDDSKDSDDNVDAAVDAAVASIVSLSVDPMVRMRLRAKDGDTIPLSPSKWREVKGEKDRCPHTVKGAITHGGPARILDVCTKKSCPKHFPVAKKKAANKGKAAAAAKAENSWEAQQRRDREAREAWERIQSAARLAFAAHLSAQPLTLEAVIRATVSSHSRKQVSAEYGVELTAKTALQVLILQDLSDWSAEAFSASTKTWGFDFKAWKKQHDADQAKAGKATLDAQRAQLAGKKGTKKAAAKKGGRK